MEHLIESSKTRNMRYHVRKLLRVTFFLSFYLVHTSSTRGYMTSDRLKFNLEQ
jgi:hypothetical protein